MSAPFITILILAVVPGLCEFLPVSSSGHLVLAQILLGFQEPDIVLDLTLHLGTLLAVVWFYRHSVYSLVRELKLLPGAALSPIRMRTLLKIRPDFRLGMMIVAASVPTAAMGLLFQHQLESMFASARAVGFALLATAGVLTATARLKPGTVDELSMTFRAALVIGLAQGLAMAPGLSRSGLTIGAALMLGFRRELAARFSFLLSIPAIVGGLALSLGQGLSSSLAPPWLVLGLLGAGICGLMALKWLTMLVDQGRLALFAPWCGLIGLFAIIWSFLAG